MEFGRLASWGWLFWWILAIFPLLASTRYTPPDNGRQKTVAQGSRGCESPQGELALDTASPLRVTEREFSLIFYYDPPVGQTSEVLLISLLHPKKPEPLFFKEVALVRSASIKVPVSAPLEPNVTYTLVAGLPCAGQKTSLKYLQVTVEYVPVPTAAVRLTPAAD